MSKVNTLGAFSFLLQFYICKSTQNNGRICDVVYRGVNFKNEKEWKSEIIKCERNIGKPVTWLGFISSSKDYNIAKAFMMPNEDGYKIMYIIDIVSNKDPSNKKADISKISSKPSEEEVLFMSGYEFNIDKIEHGNPTKIFMS